MNHLDPKTLGFNTKTPQGAQDFLNFWRGTRIHSWEIYAPLAEPVDSSATAASFEKRRFKELLNFILAKTGVVNELGTHLDLLDVEKKPGQIFRLLCRELNLRKSHFFLESPIERFRLQEPDVP